MLLHGQKKNLEQSLLFQIWLLDVGYHVYGDVCFLLTGISQFARSIALIIKTSVKEKNRWILYYSIGQELLTDEHNLDLIIANYWSHLAISNNARYTTRNVVRWVPQIQLIQPTKREKKTCFFSRFVFWHLHYITSSQLFSTQLLGKLGKRSHQCF